MGVRYEQTAKTRIPTTAPGASAAAGRDQAHFRSEQMTVASKPLPFQNRWTNAETGHHWFLQLEREGLENVKLRHALDEGRLDGEDEAPIPREFVSAWLAYRAAKEVKQSAWWRAVMLCLMAIAAIAAIVAAYYGVRIYHLMPH